jgi:hypothetical protein
MIDLINKSQAQKDVEQVNSTLYPVIQNIIAAIRALNNSRQFFWSLPDDRLNSIFAEIGTEKLQAVFENHKASAELLNELARRCGVDVVAEIGAMRKLLIVDGLVQVVPEPEPQIEPKPEPQVEPEPQIVIEPEPEPSPEPEQ